MGASCQQGHTKLPQQEDNCVVTRRVKVILPRPEDCGEHARKPKFASGFPPRWPQSRGHVQTSIADLQPTGNNMVESDVLISIRLRESQGFGFR